MLNSLPLKEYQQDVLDALEKYLQTLEACYKDKQEFYGFKLSKGATDEVHPEKSSYCYEAWEKIKAKIVIPQRHDDKGKVLPNQWRDRLDGMGRHIPNICFKVPTGGGKTLIAACALGRVSRDYFKSACGLVLWIVPSDTIYTQTRKALLNKEHPYRKQLDFESGGRTKILERGDGLNRADVENNLCVMILTLQSFNVKKKSKDSRKIYSDSGKYQSFFPEVDDYTANNSLLSQVPNLVEEDMLERNVISGVTIKQSLGNVFRLCRPIIIIDEDHKAKTSGAIENINQFNPKFILEFSATPRENTNRVVDIGGQSLKKEQMIRLPINVQAGENEDWKTTLNHAHAKLESLSKDAAKLKGQEGTYIRPMMVIIAEDKSKGDDYDHVEDIKKYLIDKCQAQAGQIKIKLSENDEIKDEDLLKDTCLVKYIITKDALREGWDCPFAYILAILAQKNSQTALTQYTGRVLRQPYAKTTSIQSLNEAYIYCAKSKVTDAVKQIKEGLEMEGMGDVADSVQIVDGSTGSGKEKVKQKRNEKFKDKIFLPTLTSVLSDGVIKPFDYYRDILGDVQWANYSCSKLPILNDYTKVSSEEIKIDYVQDTTGQYKFDEFGKNKVETIFDDHINYALLTNQLIDKIPNPFEANRILREVVQSLIKSGLSEKVIASAGHDVVRQIKDNAFEWLLERSESLFVSKLTTNQILLKLLAAPYIELNWDMGDEREVWKNQYEASSPDLDGSIFQPQFISAYNGLEKNVAAYINQSEAIKWWHRLGVKGTEYCIQGWKKDRIYPDFLVLDKGDKYIFIETKGNHLENPDSAYKKKVFDYLTAHTNKAIPIGEFKIQSGMKDITFTLVYEKEWKERLIEMGIKQ